MQVTKELLRGMLEAFGGLEVSDAEFDSVLPMVQMYADQSAELQEIDLAGVISARLLRADEGAATQ